MKSQKIESLSEIFELIGVKTTSEQIKQLVKRIVKWVISYVLIIYLQILNVITFIDYTVTYSDNNIVKAFELIIHGIWYTSVYIGSPYIFLALIVIPISYLNND